MKTKARRRESVRTVISNARYDDDMLLSPKPRRKPENCNGHTATYAGCFSFH